MDFERLGATRFDAAGGAAPLRPRGARRGGAADGDIAGTTECGHGGNGRVRSARMTPEFSRPLRAHEIGGNPRRQAIEANEAERAALAARSPPSNCA